MVKDTKVFDMPAYVLQVFKPFENGDVRGRYHLVIIDPTNAFGYPANFVCLLPRNIYEKGKPLSLFAKKFGNNSINYAIELLGEAIKHEQDKQTKAELQKRLSRLINDSNSNINLKVNC